MQEMMSGHMLGVWKNVAAGEDMAKVRLHAAVFLTARGVIAAPELYQIAFSVPLSTTGNGLWEMEHREMGFGGL